MTDIKLNQPVRVRLSDLGETILEIRDPPVIYRRDGEECEFLFWELMQVFGPCMRSGGDSPFLDGIVKVVNHG